MSAEAQPSKYGLQPRKVLEQTRPIRPSPFTTTHEAWSFPNAPNLEQKSPSWPLSLPEVNDAPPSPPVAGLKRISPIRPSDLTAADDALSFPHAPGAHEPYRPWPLGFGFAPRNNDLPPWAPNVRIRR